LGFIGVYYRFFFVDLIPLVLIVDLIALGLYLPPIFTLLFRVCRLPKFAFTNFILSSTDLKNKILPLIPVLFNLSLISGK
jgi:hypothetical protein